MYTGFFRHVGLSGNEVNELGEDSETMSESERRTRRIAHEEQKWDEEHYMYAGNLPMFDTYLLLT